jgi:hypothetical protein
MGTMRPDSSAMGMKSAGGDEAGRGLPAKKGLEARDSARIQRDDGLVMEPQIVLLQRPPEVVVYLHEPRGPAVHLLVEDHMARPAEALCLVHGDVGVSQNVLRPLAGRGVQGYADARRGEDLVRAEPEGGGHLAVDALGHQDGVLMGLYFLKQYGELVAPRRATVS